MCGYDDYYRKNENNSTHICKSGGGGFHAASRCAINQRTADTIGHARYNRAPLFVRDSFLKDTPTNDISRPSRCAAMTIIIEKMRTIARIFVNPVGEDFMRPPA